MLIRTIEPLLGTQYIELLMNTEKLLNIKETQMKKIIKPIKSHELCNKPSKICTAFVIEKEIFHGYNLITCDTLWIENKTDKSPIGIVAAPRIDQSLKKKLLRFYMLGNHCITNRNISCEDQAYKL